MTVPDLARAKGGAQWVAGLPATIAALAGTWGLTIGAPLSGGTSAYVARVTTATGDPAVLKISVPGVGFDREIRTLRAAAGRGYARLLAADPDRDAVLLEPLGESLLRSGLSPQEQLDVLAGLLPLAWQVPAEGPAEDKAAGLAGLIEEHRQPGSDRVIAEALRCADRRSAAFDPDRCVWVHGDAAAANVLRRADGWAFVDPDGFRGDPDYDRGVAARDWCEQLDAAADPGGLLLSYCRRLGGDPDPVRDWAYLERVSTGLYVESLGGRSRHLATAALLLDRA
ncbi:MAG TPA: aminoglycoside phosphotransferase family protein [Mycobacteriales bacterium]|nr:aminoglycoside phosphotransferase family protein [Mycobacteriales bacterium]